MYQFRNIIPISEPYIMVHLLDSNKTSNKQHAGRFTFFSLISSLLFPLILAESLLSGLSKV